MKPGIFWRMFPPPQYLAMRPVGLDLSDRTLKYCELAPSGDGFTLGAYGEMPLPAGVIEAGRIVDAGPVAKVLREAAPKFSTALVVLALPEEPAYTVTLTLPYAAREALRQSIELQLEEYVPLPPSGVVFDYEILAYPAREGDDFPVVVSVFPRDLAKGYGDLLAAAGLKPLALEGEAQATARALVPAGEMGTILIIDLGRTHTSFFVISRGRSLLSSTLGEIGGDFLTRAVARGLGLEAPAAEALKNERGLLQGQDQSLLYALLPAVSVLRDEIRKFITYWNSRAGIADAPPPPVERIILSGGQATLPGLAEYLASSLEQRVDIGDPWVNFPGPAERVPPLPRGASLKYVTAIGLALRPLLKSARHD